MVLGNLVPFKFWHYKNDHLLETCILGFIKCVKKTAMANVLDHRLTGNFFGSSQVESSSSLQLCLCFLAVSKTLARCTRVLTFWR